MIGVGAVSTMKEAARLLREASLFDLGRAADQVRAGCTRTEPSAT